MDDNQRSATPGCERRAQAQLLVALSGAALDRIRLMKTLFLVWYRHGRPPEGPFFFKPYLYGPCSFEVYRELDKLQAAGLVVQPNPSMQGRYFLTSAGQDAAVRAQRYLKRELATDLKKKAQWSTTLSFQDLLRAVYAKAPEFATRSVVR